MPTLHGDDAIEHLVGYLRGEITRPPPLTPLIVTQISTTAICGCRLSLPIFGNLGTEPSRRNPTTEAGRRRRLLPAVLRRGVGALPDRRYSARTKRPNGKQEDSDRVSGATASVSPKAAAGCNPRPSIRRVTRAGLGRCCSRSSAVFGEGFAQRAAEASRCYRRTNYLACCVNVRRPGMCRCAHGSTRAEDQTRVCH